MTISIEQLDERRYKVDHHEVVKDQNENWIAKTEMETKQVSAFQRHLEAVERFGVTGKATYIL